MAHSHSTHSEADSEEDEKESEEERVEETPPQQQPLDESEPEEERVEEETDEEESDVSMDVSERQQNINDACELLFKIGFKRQRFTVLNIYDHGLTYKEFLDLINPIACITDIKELKGVIGFCGNFQQFINRMKFLNTAEGTHLVTDAVNSMIKKQELEMKVGDVVRAQKLVDYANSRREHRTRLYDQINDLNRKTKELELEYVKIEKNLEKNLGPLRAYEELPTNELESRAYELYENNCKLKRVPAISDEEELGVLTALDKFGETVKERHFLDFLNDSPSRKVEIEKHLKKKIMRFEYADKKQGGAGGESSKTATKIVVYKLGSDVCEGAESCENFVVNDTRDDETAAKIVYKFGSDVLEGGGSGNPQENKTQKKRKRKRVEGKGND